MTFYKNEGIGPRPELHAKSGAEDGEKADNDQASS
jgi:hypothetical protein